MKKRDWLIALILLIIILGVAYLFRSSPRFSPDDGGGLDCECPPITDSNPNYPTESNPLLISGRSIQVAYFETSPCYAKGTHYTCSAERCKYSLKERKVKIVVTSSGTQINPQTDWTLRTSAISNAGINYPVTVEPQCRDKT